MGERLLCKQEVIGSIPFTSTRRVFIASGTGPQTRRRKRRSFFDMVKRECVTELLAVSRSLLAAELRANS